MSKSNPKEPNGKRIIYWVEVIEREPNTLDGIKVIESYPFPDVPIEPFGFDLLNFEQQIDKIEDEYLRMATSYRFHFIRNVWHPRNFIRMTLKNWKYG